MQENLPNSQTRIRAENTGPNVTAAIGLAETSGRLRARRSSLFAQTIIWVTALICLVLLTGSLAQAWSNSQLMQRVQAAQQQLQQIQAHHNELLRLVNYYKDPFVIETEAREQLGYIRPGEHPVVIVTSTGTPSQPPSRHSSPPRTQNFWQEWWDIFFGK